MTMNQTPQGRKEILQLNGVTILAVLVVIANFLVVGFIYRYHSHELYRENKAHDIEYTALLGEQHKLHIDIAKLEHVTTWNDTAYAKSQHLPNQRQ